ncbi:hypothetical protein AUC69_05865 [Methyloceanibacter superfactus]|uniref:Uncharacterized protein n=1 Tax=Methyloceanibacter superfactus TaxID=1774969 RepID=A0A1E3W7I2_9HYPH|nr:hypothetical protein [Methyloceanibacter superfactus]ODS01763.1 hypothetical protein AUC69_05865 [Methyloceanibacter superfactus]
MGLDAESVIERRRLKRRVTIWRIAAVVFALLFFGALFLADKQMAGSAGILPMSPASTSAVSSPTTAR